MRRSVWCETVSWERLATREVLSLARRFDVDLLVAVRPGQEIALVRALAACADAGVRAAAWPMLEDAQGRWASAKNAGAFAAMTLGLVEAVGASLSGVAIDLEPSFVSMERALAQWWTIARGAPRRRTPAEGTERLASLTRELAARRVEVTLAILPLVAWDLEGRARWQARLGTPIDPLAFDRASAMVYTSLLEGWSRGALGRDDARCLLAACARAMKRRFGARASVSLGCVGTGAFGDEPIYRSPAELADDVALVRRSGIEDIVMFDLGGALARGPAEAWLEALVATPAADALPSPTLAARAAIALARGGARV